MSHQLKISDIIIGGNAVNNPPQLTLANYELSGGELSFRYRQLNVIAFHKPLQVSLQVTGLVKENEQTGLPMVSDNDPVYLPCPPFCHL
jgi:hypothetical protein